MKAHVSLGTLILAAALLVSAQGRVSAGTMAVSQTWMPYPNPPPVALSWDEEHGAAQLKFPGIGVTGRVSYDLYQKRVTVSWMKQPGRTSNQQRITVSYWPTAMAVLSDGKTLIIAGKRRNGNTVIETWRFHMPLVLLPTPPATGSAHLQDAVIDEITTIYDAAVQGQDMVAHLFAKPTEPTSALAQFYDSRSVYQLNFAAAPASCTLVAVPSGGSGSVLTVPRLADNFTSVWSADHVTKGYVYFFVNDESGSINPLALIDANRDHAIDSWSSVSASQWISDGWATWANYVPH
jgi:hypothetical protein